MRDCKTCIHSEIGHGEGNGCTAWTCEYIKKKEALKAYKEQMEIVTCKDCKHWDNIYNGYCYRLNALGMKPNDFCSLGERRKNE